MISIVANLWQNTGTPAAGQEKVLTGNLVKLGDRSLGIDDQLTKIQAGELTVEIQDPDDSIWDWIQSQLAIETGLLPPWLEILVEGNTEFLGIVDPSRVVHHTASDQHSIELGAQDWSVMLSNQYLDTLTRPAPRKATGRPAVADLSGYSTWIKNLSYGAGLCDVLFSGSPNWVSPGDRLTAAACPGVVFTALAVKSPADAGLVADLGDNPPFPSGTLTQVTLDQSPWTNWRTRSWNAPGGAGLMDTFTRLESATTDQTYFVVTLAIPANPPQEVYVINLDTVDGITTGDKLHCILGTKADSWTIMSVNPELLQVTTLEPVNGLDVGNRVYFDDATNAELVLQDVKTILAQAAAPYQVDTSRFVHAQLPSSVFGWLPLQSAAGMNDLMAVSDLEPNATGGVRVFSGLALAFDGAPDEGWAALGSCPPQNADWTGQLTAPPASLMPYEVKALSPLARRRNRAYHDFNWNSVDNGPDPVGSDPSKWVDPWTAADANQIPVQVFYDYLAMRRVTVAAGGQGVTGTPWTGAVWGSGAALAWPSSNQIQSITSFPGGPAGSLLALTKAGTLELALFPGVASCAVPAWLQGGVLVPTPAGPYLIGPKGYGKVSYAGGALSLVAAVFADLVTCFWPNTFVARTATEGVILGRLDVSDGTGGTTTETWLYRLKLPPDTSTPTASIILSEKVTDGVPVFAGAMADPTKAGRVIGQFGGRLFQVDTVMPWTVERFTPSGMSSLECLEHVAQLQNAMVVPSAPGVLAMISRGVPESAINLEVLVKKVDQTLAWDKFYSIVRVTTQDGALYFDAPGQDGGNILEISNHPMVWSLSQAGAMASSYAAFFGIPRAVETHEWTWPDATTVPPWAALPPFARVTVNGTGPWRVMSLKQNDVDGTAEAVLVKDN